MSGPTRRAALVAAAVTVLFVTTTAGPAGAAPSGAGARAAAATGSEPGTDPAPPPPGPASRVPADAPTAPRPTTNAPPDPFHDAPTPAIHRVVSGLRLESKSVNLKLSARPGLGAGSPVRVAVRFTTASPWQEALYSESSGLVLRAAVPHADFASRLETVTVRLQDTATGASYLKVWGHRVNPVADVRIGDLTFGTSEDCDPGVPPWSAPDPDVYWRDAHGRSGLAALGDNERAGRIPEFAHTLTEVSAADGLRAPTAAWNDRDPVFDPGADPKDRGPLLPARTDRVAWTEEATSGDCSAELAFEMTVTPRSYPTF